jgi:hypothetical protein
MGKNFVDKILQVDYHRNGVSGEGFHVVQFVSDKKNMVGIVFGQDSMCAVLEVGNLNNKWRGDCFEGELRDAIDVFEEERQL